MGEGCHMDWVWLFLCLRLKIVDISISCKTGVNQMLHQYPSPVLRVVYLTAAGLGKQCENKKGMKRPMSTRLRNILAALPDIISIRERKKEGVDEEIVLVLSSVIMAHSKKNYCFQICGAQKILLFFCYQVHIHLNKNAILWTGSHLFYSMSEGLHATAARQCLSPGRRHWGLSHTALWPAETVPGCCSCCSSFLCPWQSPALAQVSSWHLQLCLPLLNSISHFFPNCNPGNRTCLQPPG